MTYLIAITLIIIDLFASCVHTQEETEANNPQDSYGIYDKESGLMLEYKTPDVGGYAPSLDPTTDRLVLDPLVVAVDNQEIYSKDNHFHMVVDRPLEPMTIYITSQGTKLRIIDDWNYIKGTRYSYKFKAFGDNKFPFNAKSFLFTHLTPQDDITDRFRI